MHEFVCVYNCLGVFQENMEVELHWISSFPFLKNRTYFKKLLGCNDWVNQGITLMKPKKMAQLPHQLQGFSAVMGHNLEQSHRLTHDVLYIMMTGEIERGPFIIETSSLLEKTKSQFWWQWFSFILSSHTKGSTHEWMTRHMPRGYSWFMQRWITDSKLWLCLRIHFTL